MFAYLGLAGFPSSIKTRGKSSVPNLDNPQPKPPATVAMTTPAPGFIHADAVLGPSPFAPDVVVRRGLVAEKARRPAWRHSEAAEFTVPDP